MLDTKHMPMLIANAWSLPFPLTVTVGTLPELAPDCLASILVGVPTALASAADAAVMAIEPFIMLIRCRNLKEWRLCSQENAEPLVYEAWFGSRQDKSVNARSVDFQSKKVW